MTSRNNLKLNDFLRSTISSTFENNPRQGGPLVVVMTWIRGQRDNDSAQTILFLPSSVIWYPFHLIPGHSAKFGPPIRQGSALPQRNNFRPKWTYPQLRLPFVSKTHPSVKLCPSTYAIVLIKPGTYRDVITVGRRLPKSKPINRHKMNCGSPA